MSKFAWMPAPMRPGQTARTWNWAWRSRTCPAPTGSRPTVRGWTVATNKSPIGPYRGVARPGACFCIERTIDEIARAVGREPHKVRLENMVTPDLMPYRSVTSMLYDNGDYPQSVAKAVDLLALPAVRARDRKRAVWGKRVSVR